MVSILILPFTTQILGPADYGVFALLMGFTSFGGSIAAGAVTYLVSSRFSSGSAAERRHVISSLLAVVAGVGLLLALLLAAVWYVSPLEQERWGASGIAVACALASMLLGIPWSIAYIVLIVSQDASQYARITVCATIAAALTTLVTLYGFHLGGTALFAGMLASALIQSAGGLIVLTPHLGRPDRQLTFRALRLTFVGFWSNSLEVVQTLAERVLLGAHAGLHDLGLYAHAQQYRNAVFLPVKAVANAVWSVTLTEAKDAERAFPRTRRAWRAAYLGLALAGVGFACFGREVVALLTNGKFVDAGPYAALLIALLLVQFSGRPQLGVLLERDQGEYVSLCMGVSAAAGITCLLLAVPSFGIIGAVIALYVQQVMFRLGVQWRARREGRTPSADGLAWASTVLIVAVLVWSEMSRDLPVRAAAFALASFVLLFIARDVIADLAHRYRGMLGSFK